MSWGAVIAAAGAVVGGVIASDGAGDAADTQAQGARDAADAQLQAQREAIKAQQPFLDAGYASTNKLLQLLGLGGDKASSDYGSLNTPFSFKPEDLASTPGYQFQLQQGQNALDRRAAASGGFYSGAALKDATGYAQNLANSTFGDEYNRQFNAYQTGRANILNPLQAMSGQGQTSANTVSGVATNGGNALANILTGNANAQGAAQIARSNAIGGSISNGLSAWQQANYLNNMQPQRGYGMGGSQGYFTQWGGGGGFGSGTFGMGD